VRELEKNITSELDTIKELVISVLAENANTRSNETLLYLECCKKLGAKTMDDLQKMNLSIITVHKLRQVIQNKDGLFRSEEKVRKHRVNRASKIKEYMIRLNH